MKPRYSFRAVNPVSVTLIRAAILFIVAGSLAFLTAGGCGRRGRVVNDDRIARFEQSLQRLQRDLEIPGMAAVILEGQEVRWAKGFGYADLEKKIPATPETPFQLCSVTKPVAAMVIHRLVEQGKLDLDTPLSKYGIDYDDEGTVRLVHLMTHTSKGVPGTTFSYDGDRYGVLGTAVRHETGKSFRTLLVEDVLGPLEMTDAAPNPADAELLERFAAYRERKGIDRPILDEAGNEWPVCDLFDYDDPDYYRTIILSASLLADYFDGAGVKKEQFLRYEQDRADGATVADFADFYAESNEYLDIYKRLATPYKRHSAGNVAPGVYSMFFNPAAGLNASVSDMAKFDIALDNGFFVSRETLDRAWEPYVTAGGDTLPYGLGWASQEYAGTRIIWHGGEWSCASALYLKVPELDLTLIVECNSRLLSQAFAMGLNDVTESGFGLEFLRIFVYEPKFGEQGPDIDWAQPLTEQAASLADRAEATADIGNAGLRDIYVKEMQVMERMYMVLGRPEIVSSIFDEVHTVLLPGSLHGKYDGIPVLAAIEEVGDSEDRTVEFDLESGVDLRVYGTGEISGDDAWDFGWIEDRSTGSVVWTMAGAATTHAGGAPRNRLVDEAVHLEAGRYALRYRSDDAHSYKAWYSSAPDHLYWGIRLHREPRGDVSGL